MKKKLRNPFAVFTFYLGLGAVYSFFMGFNETGWFLVILAIILIVYDNVTEAKK